VILHRERANNVFGKRSSQLLARFVKFFTTARLPLRRSRAEGHHLQRELRQADRRLHPVIIVKELQVTYGSCSQIMSYIFNMLICVGMILLDNLLQYFMFIAMIDLSRTYGTTTILICYALVMFMIYSWIKIKSKVLIYLSLSITFLATHFLILDNFFSCQLHFYLNINHRPPMLGILQTPNFFGYLVAPQLHHVATVEMV
jgi:hypothetical protein